MKAFLGVVVNMRDERIYEMKEYFSKKLGRQNTLFHGCIFLLKIFPGLLDATHTTISWPRILWEQSLKTFNHINLKYHEYFEPDQFISVNKTTIGFKVQVLCYNVITPRSLQIEESEYTPCVTVPLLILWHLFHTMKNLRQMA